MIGPAGERRCSANPPKNDRGTVSFRRMRLLLAGGRETSGTTAEKRVLPPRWCGPSKAQRSGDAGPETNRVRLRSADSTRPLAFTAAGASDSNCPRPVGQHIGRHQLWMSLTTSVSSPVSISKK